MDLVANVMLGNSTAPEPGKLAGKAAGRDFAAFLPFREAVAGEATDQAGPAKGPAGNKKGQPDAKQSELASQLATCNIPVFLPQASLLAAAKTASPGMGDGVSKTDESEKDAAKNATQQVAAEITNDANVVSPLNVGSDQKFRTQNSGSDNPLKPNVQPEATRIAAPKLGGEKTVHPNLATDVVAGIATKQADAKNADAKPTEKPVAPQQKAPEAIPPLDKIHPQEGVTQAAAKPAHAIESLASSAVRIALKQTLPGQSKLANVPTTAALPNKPAFAASQTANGHAQQDSSHPAAASHESQPAHDQTKKQTDAAITAAQSGVDTQSGDQVNAAGRVASPGLTTENPKQSLGAPASTGTALAARQDLPVHETPVATSSPLSLHSARLLETLGQSELRVGMKMGDLGNVEIRTQLHHDQLHAEISVERGDLGHTLAAEMPAIQQKLRDHDIPLASIVVNHQAAAGSGSFERGSQQQQQMTTPMSHVFGAEPVLSSSSPEETRTTDSALDIRI